MSEKLEIWVALFYVPIVKDAILVLKIILQLKVTYNDAAEYASFYIIEMTNATEHI